MRISLKEIFKKRCIKIGLIINRAILHIIDNSSKKILVSGEELDVESENTYGFIKKHVKRLLNSPECNEATFNKQSEIYHDLLKFKDGEIYFKDFSKLVADKLSDILLKNIDIQPADLLVVYFMKDDVNHIGIIKLNYNECFVHTTKVDNDGNIDNQITKYLSVLPLTGAKVSEACIIPFEPMVIRLVEKTHLIDGNPEYYFSKLFLDCEPEISKKEAVEILDEINKDIANKYYGGSLDAIATMTNAVISQSEEDDGILRIESIASKAFENEPDIKEEYINLLKESGIVRDLDIGDDYIKKFFGMQKFKADNGVEIKFPAELTFDNDYIEFQNNSDGSVNVTFKRLRPKAKD